MAQEKDRVAMPFSAAETTLVLIDLQERLMPAIENGAVVLVAVRCWLAPRECWASPC